MTQYIEIAGAKIAKRDVDATHAHAIPAVDNTYVWGINTFDIVEDINDNKRTLLTGHSGTGKSSVFLQIAARIGQPCIRQSLSGGLAVSDFVGTYTIKDKESVWVDGILTFAMRHGYWIILDEVDAAEPNILFCLNQVLESAESGESYLSLKEKGYEIVRPHKDFRIFATANTIGIMQRYRHLYQGTNIMNAAFMLMLRIYHIDYLPEELEIELICKKFPSIPPIFAKPLVIVANLIRESFANDEISQPFSLRTLFDWVYQIVRHSKDKSKPALERILHAANSTVFSRLPPEDAEVIRGIIVRVIKTGKVEPEKK
jgi:cobaltochelatase CobS